MVIVQLNDLYEILEMHMAKLKCRLTFIIFWMKCTANNLVKFIYIYEEQQICQWDRWIESWGTYFTWTAHHWDSIEAPAPHKCILQARMHIYVQVHTNICSVISTSLSPPLCFIFEFVQKCKMLIKMLSSSLQVGKNPCSSCWGWFDLWCYKEICGQCRYCF